MNITDIRDKSILELVMKKIKSRSNFDKEMRIASSVVDFKQSICVSSLPLEVKEELGCKLDAWAEKQRQK